MSADFHAEPTESAYDPELPFLVALEREIHRAALRTARQGRAPGRARTATAPLTGEGVWQRQRERRGAHLRLAGVSRISRRSLTLVALLCLVGASAFGAREIFSGGNRNPAVVRQGPPVLAATGRVGSDRWSLRMYRRDAEMCSELAVAETEASRCAPTPRPEALTVTSTVSPLRRYVFGVAGAMVAQVSIRVGKSRRLVATRAMTAEQIHVGLPADTRWFLVNLARPAGASDPPAFTRGLDSKGHVLDGVQTSCVETGASLSC
jgi:hypothetical protein